jgi:hypothetical protein
MSELEEAARKMAELKLALGLPGDALLADGDPGDTLDAAWAEAEAALPEGWVCGVQGTDLAVPGRLYDAWAGVGRHWDEHAGRLADTPPECFGFGPTPAAALRELAARLRERAG